MIVNRMSLRGAKELAFGRFRGVNLEVDPTELPAEIGATGSQNIDFEGETLRNRGGATAYNAAAVGGGASKIQGIGAYYPRSGTRVLLIACNGSVFADRNQDGDFLDATETLVSGLSATDPVDFWQFRDKIYFGTKTDGVYVWDGVTAGASLLAAITAPASAPTLAPSIAQFESFDSGAFTSTNAALTSAYDATIRLEGSSSLKLTVTGSGALNAFVYRLQSGVTDLSEVEELVLWVQGNLPGLQFKIGIYDDTQTVLANGPTWDRFPVFAIEQANVWTKIRVPLSAIPVEDRGNIPGIAIKFISEGGRGYTTNPVLYFDDGKGQGQMEPDRYEYRYTYRQADSAGNVIRESAPSPAGYVDLKPDAPFKGVTATPAASADGTVNQIAFYRKRDHGVWAVERLVKTRSNAASAITDVRTDDNVLADPTAVQLHYYRDVPPKAATYTMVGARLWCGDVVVGGTRYPNRVYVGTFNDPESFSPSEHVRVMNPTSASWFDLPRGVTVRRIVDVDGMAVIFTDRDIWSVEGDGWDNFIRRPRANVGLDARWAVVATDRLHYFLSRDGVRVLSANRGYAGQFPTWVISEPVESKVEGINTTYRPQAAMGVDERGRVHLSYLTLNGAVGEAVVFDPRQKGSLAQGEQPLRPGWTFYNKWGWAVFHTLPRDATDSGQMIGGYGLADGTKALGKLYYIQRNAAFAEIAETDSMEWAWFSAALDGGPGAKLQAVHITLTFNSVPLQEFSARIQIDMYSQPSFSTFAPSQVSGVESKTVRLPASANGRMLQVQLYSSTFSSSIYVARNVSLGYYRRR